MKEIFKVFMLDNVKSVRSRLELILNREDFNVIEAANSSEFFNGFLQNKCDGNLVIMDIELRDEDGFEVIRKIRDKNKNIPIIILTANNHRDIFIKGIFEGATDYILKPFEDLLVKNKVNKILNSYTKEVNADNSIIYNLPFFLELEFKKSRKGNYTTSIMMITLYKPNKTHSEEVEKEYLIASELLYNNLKNIFWDTDIFTRYGSQSFIGIFPFTNKDKVSIISDKINECFNNLKQENKIFKDYFLSNVSIIYPEDINKVEDVIEGEHVTEVDEVILRLIDKTKEAIKISKEIPQQDENIKE